MRVKRVRLGLAAALLLGPLIARAAEIARWEAGEPPLAQGLSLERAPDSVWRIEPTASGLVARLKPSQDYFRRSAFVARVAKSIAGRVWLRVEFLDRGYGLITVSPRLPQRSQSGVARVASGKLRRAVFRFDHAESLDSIRLEGLDYLRSLTLSGDAPPPERAPLVEPAIRFRVPSQRVTTASGDLLDVQFLPQRGTIELLEVGSAGANGLSPAQVEEALAGLGNQLPLARALGFNGIESYVRWGFVESKPGVYDWSFYDATLEEIEKHGLQWFPMLMAGSGYALPEWLYNSSRNVGYVCLEHGLRHDTQSIFYEFQADYASRFIAEFGKHYRGRKGLLGIRLGPNGDYGEAQYPARGPGYKFRESHTHIGHWAGDPYAEAAFRKHLGAAYGDIASLNRAWRSSYASFDQIRTFLPQTAATPRQRIDFATWYMGAMSEWCQRWAEWARQALPETVIHQSSGGWGAVPIGTDYSYQARSMARLKGGIRLTNESDAFPDSFTITRMASSAARFYGAALGYEPGGGYGGKRGVTARLFNAVTNGAEHLFYYQGNLTADDGAIDAWLRLGRLMDERAKPVIDVAAFYPDTAIKLDDEVLRYRWGSAYFSMARALRSEMDYDYASEQMILDGALARYKVLVFLWGRITERPVLERIDRWIRDGGTVFFPVKPRGELCTVEGDASIARRWQAGDTGKGRAFFYRGDAIPAGFYAEFIREQLLKMPRIRPQVRAALGMDKPAGVFWSVLKNGKLALLNFSNRTALVRLDGGKALKIDPYEIAME